MQGKFTSSTLILFLVLVLFSMSLLLVVEAAGDIFSTQQEIISLIKAGKLADAQIQTEQLKIDYSEDPQLPHALYRLGRRYEWLEYLNEAEELYNYIIQNHADSQYASNARIGLARKGVLSLVLSGQYDQAQEAIDTLISDFVSDPCLPDSLYWIAERYRWARKWEKANNIYEQIIQNYPDSHSASRANLGLARAEVLSLLNARDYEGADQAFDKLVTDFPEHSDLPETLYWIAEEYKWKYKHEKAISIHQQIVQNHPNSPYARQSRLGLVRTEILSLIENRKYEQADDAIETMVADFAGHPDLPGTLYWIAAGYRYMGKYDRSVAFYQQILQNYPDTKFARKTQQNLPVVARGLEIHTLIESDQIQTVPDLINNLITDFREHELLPYTVFLCAEKYFDKALEQKSEGSESEAAENFARAIAIWKTIITQDLHNSPNVIVDSHYFLAQSYMELEDYEKAFENYVIIAQECPDYRNAADAQFMVGHCCEKLKYAGLLPKDEADKLTKESYETLLRDYPDCQHSQFARSWLKRYEGNLRRRKENK